MRKYLLQILGISTHKDPKYSLQIELFYLIISQTVRILLFPKTLIYSYSPKR